MPDRSVPLTTIKGGITRLRTKGAALNDSLFDLLNGYVTVARTVKVRPGTYRHAILPVDTFGSARTKGLTAFDGKLHIFSVHSLDPPDGFELHVIRHPAGQNSDGTLIELKKIHFAAPFMGFLYVVAEFEEADFSHGLGDVFHFWIQTGDAWAPDTTYSLGSVVVPNVLNGFSYQAGRRLSPFPSWSANVSRAVGDRIEPTVFNGFYYEVVDTAGSSPISGTIEPDWPEEDGAQIIEEAEATTTPEPVATDTPDVSLEPDPDIVDRYLNIFRQL